jgi:hypothetical protein
MQQQQGQKMLDYPMLQAQNYAKLFGTPTIPAGSTEQKVGPATQLTPSPLGQITSLLSGLGSIMWPNNQGSSTTINPTAQSALASQGYSTDDISKIFNVLKGVGNIFMKEGGSAKPAKLSSHAKENLKRIMAKRTR